jgi:hypothetical protein
MRAPKFKVVVEGTVHIGEILSDREIPPEEEAYDSDPDDVEDSVLAPHQRTQVRALSSERTKRSEFRHELDRTGEGLSITDDGLALQYGIFGEPGSGKTNLLSYLLSQIVVHRTAADPKGCDRTRQYGGIILDPKAALIDDVRAVFAQAGRENDLIVINSRELACAGGINLLDCMLKPRDLAKAIVLGAQSSGVGGADDYWFQQMSSTFAAILTVLQVLDDGRKPTLNRLLETALGRVTTDRRSEPALDRLIHDAERFLVRHRGPEFHDARVQLETLQRHLAADPKNRITVEQFMEQAFGLFRDQAYQCYSADAPTDGRTNLYDKIIDDGKVLLVSTGPQEVELSSILPTLIKVIFQRTVLSRFERYKDFQLHNRDRPVLFLADEYHMVATQIEGKKIGDSEYFSQARESGGLCLVATQTVEQLEASALGKNWRAIFGTLAAVIGMRVRDPATFKYLQERGGTLDVQETSQGDSSKQGDVTVSENYQRTEISEIATGALKRFGVGDAVVVGTTGPNAPASIHYIHVPDWKSDRA